MLKSLQAELHCHTNHNQDKNVFFGPFADSTQTAEDIIRQCQKKNIKVLAITDHDSLEGYFDAKKIIEDNQLDIVLIPGAEITAKGCHILAYGIKEIIPPKLSPKKTIDLIHKQGGLAIAAHPFMPPFFLGLRIFSLPFDGIEGLNASIPMLPNLLCTISCYIFRKKYIASSDAHETSGVGNGKTIFPPNTTTPETAMKHLKSGSFSISFHHSSYVDMFIEHVIDAINRLKNNRQISQPSPTLVRTPPTTL